MLDILLVDDEPSILLPVDEALRAEGYRTTTALDGLSAQAALTARVFDVVVSDVRLPNVDGFTLFKKVRHESPRTRVILMTAWANVPDAVGALKLGAVDYLPKPFELDTLLKLLERIAREQQLEDEFRAQRGQAGEDNQGLVGRSPAMDQFRSLLSSVAQRNEPVLLAGEPGSGKAFAAQLLHRSSPRAERPFISFSCVAVPEARHEAELFGLEGATGRAPPLAVAAAGGTLFIDALTELSVGAQARLLELLDSPTDVRVVATANEPLLGAGRPRVSAQLAHRISELELRLPPLRERGGDLLLLTEHFLRRFSHPAAAPELSAGALAAICAYPFPGNVRELSTVLRRAVVLSSGRRVELSHLPPEIVGHHAPAQEQTGAPPLPEAVRAFEREYVKRALQRTEGRKAAAARQLGISRKNLWEKLKGYGITEQEIGDVPESDLGEENGG